MSKAMMWIYHSTKTPKMVPHSDMLPAGWSDTPAAFTEPEPDLMNMFNDNHDSLSKPELAELAEKLGIDLPSRSSKAQFVAAIIEYTEE